MRNLLREALGLAKVFLATRTSLPCRAARAPLPSPEHQVALARLPDLYPLGYEKIPARELLPLLMSSASDDAGDQRRNAAQSVVGDQP